MTDAVGRRLNWLTQFTWKWVLKWG